MNAIANPLQVAAGLTEYWSPRVIGEIDDNYVKVAKGKGDLGWHSHTGEDEFFYVLQGSLKLKMHNGDVVLNSGDSYIMPKGVEHNPVAEHECLFMLIERKSTLHTGDTQTGKTRSIEEQLAG